MSLKAFCNWQLELEYPIKKIVKEHIAVYQECKLCCTNMRVNLDIIRQQEL